MEDYVPGVMPTEKSPMPTPEMAPAMFLVLAGLGLGVVLMMMITPKPKPKEYKKFSHAAGDAVDSAGAAFNIALRDLQREVKDLRRSVEKQVKERF